MPFFGAFGAARDDAMLRVERQFARDARAEMDAAFVASGGNGGPPVTARRPVVLFLAG